MKSVLRWVLRIALLYVVAMATSKAYQASRQVIDGISTMGKDGKLRSLTCTTFDYDACLHFHEEIASKYSSLASAPRELQEKAENTQQQTFIWGVVSLLSGAGLMLSFLRFSKPRRDEPS